MGFCICNRTTGLIRCWEANAQNQPFDSATETVIETPTAPDFRLQRWNGGTGVRPATNQEITDSDASMTDLEAQARVSDKMLKALTIYLVQRLNELRTQPTTVFPALTAVEVRNSLITIYKGL